MSAHTVLLYPPKTPAQSSELSHFSSPWRTLLSVVQSASASSSRIHEIRGDQSKRLQRAETDADFRGLCCFAPCTRGLTLIPTESTATLTQLTLVPQGQAK